MNVALFNTFDRTGGAAKAALRLQEGLVSLGVEANLFVREKTLHSPSVHATGSTCGGRLRSLLDYLPQKLYPHRQQHNFSAARVSTHASEVLKGFSPDIVNLHWIPQGFVSVEEIALISLPIVWTLHDSWPFTGGCHLPGECLRYQQSCGCCQALGSAQPSDLSHRVWMRKQKAWAKLNLTCVAPSRWLADCARNSSLLGTRRIKVIPNGIDISLYCPGDRQAARIALGLPLERKLVLFGANHALSDPNKGFDLLQAALLRLDSKLRVETELVIVGADPCQPSPDCGLSVRNLGVITDEEQLTLLYRAADLFVAPSRQETLGYMVMESLSCGTPCVSFAVGGLIDLIDHGENGYLARAEDSADLGWGITWLLEDSMRRDMLGRRGRQKVERNFALPIVSGHYLQLYREVLKGSHVA